MGCSCGKMYVWKLKKAELGVHEYNVVLNNRRDEMLSVETSDGGEFLSAACIRCV